MDPGLAFWIGSCYGVWMSPPITPSPAFRASIQKAILEGHPAAYELFMAWMSLGASWEVAEEITVRQLCRHAHALSDGPAN